MVLPQTRIEIVDAFALNPAAALIGPDDPRWGAPEAICHVIGGLCADALTAAGYDTIGCVPKGGILSITATGSAPATIPVNDHLDPRVWDQRRFTGRDLCDLLLEIAKTI